MPLLATKTPLGDSAPDFTLPEPLTGNTHALNDHAGKPLLVVFICNHCPYVIHLLKAFVAVATELQSRGIEVVTISSNDILRYPADAPDKMAALATEYEFTFPYLYDESQDIARAYDAQCTPDIYLYDDQHKLYYRGQFDDTRPNKGTATGKDLLAAAHALLNGEPPADDVPPSAGCGIKWKEDQ